jgi:hypothetical protein
VEAHREQARPLLFTERSHLTITPQPMTPARNEGITRGWEKRDMGSKRDPAPECEVSLAYTQS